MLRFKQFSGSGSELETAINGWLTAYEPEVSQMVQTTDSVGTVTISFLFEESFRGQEIRLTQESDARAGRGQRPPAPVASEDKLEVRAGPE